MGRFIRRWVLALMLGAALVAPASADISAVRAALAKQDYVEAKRLLADPSLAGNAEAFMLLAKMAHEGWGQPVNNIDAYAFLTLDIMAHDKVNSPKAVPARRHVAYDMSLTDIRAAEQQVITQITAARGQAALQDDVGRLIVALNACHTKCDALAAKVVSLGPAGFLASPRLEQLMTEDPMWMPRQSYADALFSIGTAAVPALCRIAEDKAELQSEGTWNLIQAAFSLGGMGPAAGEGRACLVRMLSNLGNDQPALQKQLSQDVGGDPNALLMLAVRNLVFALVAIDDPSRVNHAEVAAAYQADPSGPKAALISYLLGMNYGELQPAIDQAGPAFAKGTTYQQTEMLNILTDLAAAPGFAALAKPLIPALQVLIAGPDPTISGMAKKLLDQIIQ